MGRIVNRRENGQCRWVKPKLVCQVAFVEWTDAGHLRHCTFIGMRDDKEPAEVVRETSLKTKSAGGYILNERRVSKEAASNLH